MLLLLLAILAKTLNRLAAAAVGCCRLLAAWRPQLFVLWLKSSEPNASALAVSLLFAGCVLRMWGSCFFLCGCC